MYPAYLEEGIHLVEDTRVRRLIETMPPLAEVEKKPEGFSEKERISQNARLVVQLQDGLYWRNDPWRAADSALDRGQRPSSNNLFQRTAKSRGR